MPIPPSRDVIIEAILDDMPAWLKRDASGFWEHVQDLERQFLEAQTDGELLELYQNSVD